VKSDLGVTLGYETRQREPLHCLQLVRIQTTGVWAWLCCLTVAGWPFPEPEPRTREQLRVAGGARCPRDPPEPGRLASGTDLSNVCRANPVCLNSEPRGAGASIDTKSAATHRRATRARAVRAPRPPKAASEAERQLRGQPLVERR